MTPLVGMALSEGDMQNSEVGAIKDKRIKEKRVEFLQRKGPLHAYSWVSHANRKVDSSALIKICEQPVRGQDGTM